MRTNKAMSEISKLLINIGAKSNKNNYAISVFLIRGILTFEQAVALTDVYSEPSLVEESIIIDFLLEEVDVETAVEVFSN